jgi:hypothetical protein
LQTEKITINKKVAGKRLFRLTLLAPDIVSAEQRQRLGLASAH